MNTREWLDAISRSIDVWANPIRNHIERDIIKPQKRRLRRIFNIITGDEINDP